MLAALNEAAARSDREVIAYDYSLQLSAFLDDVVVGVRLRPDAVMGWNGWRNFDDVIVAQAPEELSDGTFDVAGVYLNPLGRAQRPADFREDEALRMMSQAVEAASAGEQQLRRRGAGADQ